MDVILTPSIFLAMWAGGLAGCGVLIRIWKVGTKGFTWLLSGTVVGLGTVSSVAEPGIPVILSTLAAGASLLGRRPWAPILLAGSASGFLAAAWAAGGSVAAVTGAVALGGITAEMLLGHWFLVDPRLPRRPLRRLDVIASTGLLADVLVLALAGAVPWESSEAFWGWVFLGLTLTTLILLAAVWFSLGERGYSAVMAATGLSYLAVLTVAGGMVAGRLLLSAGPLFS